MHFRLLHPTFAISMNFEKRFTNHSRSGRFRLFFCVLKFSEGVKRRPHIFQEESSLESNSSGRVRRSSYFFYEKTSTTFAFLQLILTAGWYTCTDECNGYPFSSPIIIPFVRNCMFPERAMYFTVTTWHKLKQKNRRGSKLDLLCETCKKVLLIGAASEKG